MGWYTDWFLAEESEAETLGTLGDEESEHNFDDWPHLSMKSIGVMELESLQEVLEIKEGGGEQLYFNESEEAPVFVSRVAPAFVTAIAGLKPAAIPKVAKKWQEACSSLENWKASDCVEVLTEMAQFAARAEREKKPVLELM